MRKFLILIFFITYFNGPEALAQLNFGVGYSLGYLNPEIDKQIISEYNSSRPWLDDELEELNFIQGFNLSLRYKLEFVALDFTWRNKFRSKKASGIDPSTNATHNRDLLHRLNSFSLGIENFVGDFSYGGSIDFERFNIKTTVTGINGSYKIIDFDGIGSHFFIAYNLNAGEFLDFSIRPYVHIPWQKYNLDAYANDLNEDQSQANREENYMNFGIMFVFYNGSR